MENVESCTSTTISKVENDLSKTSLTKTIEDVVKKKISKRLDELKLASEKTIHGVETQIN